MTPSGANGATSDDLLATFIDEELAEAPTAATSLGVDGHDHELPDLSASAFARRAARTDHWLSSFEAVADDSLALDQSIDRDLVLAALRGRIVMRDWEVWKRDPQTYLGPCLSGVFSLFLNRVHPEPDLARFAAARLRLVPEVLAQGAANLDPDLAPALFIERALGACQAGVGYARNLVPEEVSDSTLRAELVEAGEVAAAAFTSFSDTLRALIPTCTGEWAIGEARYSALLEQKELLGYGAATMRGKGQAAYDELSAEMERVAAQIDPQASGWREVVEALNQDHPATPEEMRDTYDTWTQKARQFLIDHGIVTLADGERCNVVPSPPFQRPVLAVASYSTPPMFKESMTGHFFVPFPPDGTSAEDVQKRLETNSRASIPTIAVHEAYPGHHWHLTWTKVNKIQERRVRALLPTAYFSEGWALYAERVMREFGFFSDPRHDLCHLDARIFRAARIVVDTSLHMGEMTVDEAVRFMMDNASLSEPTARAEVGRYCTWPTQASSYLTGSLEIERIRVAFEKAGKGDVRAFNDKLAASGMLPIALAERAVMSG
ncbi:MAG TPA: DUF885 domain-containing protein [Acidimicrobiales bacterium]|nr:DUF885 domain-containing protein [Acidimicrobiales bacterium]